MREEGLRKVERLVADHGLALNRDKTRVTSFEPGLQVSRPSVCPGSLVIAGTAPVEISEVEALMRRVAREDAKAEAKTAGQTDREAVQRRHGLDPGQRILYVVSADRRLSVRNQAFSVESGEGGGSGEAIAWREILALPHQAVDRIEIGPQSSATMMALRHALATDTALAFVDGHGETLGWVAPRFGPRAARHWRRRATCSTTGYVDACAQIRRGAATQSPRALAPA